MTATTAMPGFAFLSTSASSTNSSDLVRECGMCSRSSLGLAWRRMRTAVPCGQRCCIRARPAGARRLRRRRTRSPLRGPAPRRCRTRKLGRVRRPRLYLASARSVSSKRLMRTRKSAAGSTPDLASVAAGLLDLVAVGDAFWNTRVGFYNAGRRELQGQGDGRWCRNLADGAELAVAEPGARAL